MVAGGNIEEAAYTDTEEGIIVNSGFINGLEVKDAIAKISKWLEKKDLEHLK